MKNQWLKKQENIPRRIPCPLEGPVCAVVHPSPSSTVCWQLDGCITGEDYLNKALELAEKWHLCVPNRIVLLACSMKYLEECRVPITETEETKAFYAFYRTDDVWNGEELKVTQ